MYSIFFDVETTGLNPQYHEIIEGYFSVYNNDIFIDDYNLKSRVNLWSEEAYEIHKIPYKKMINYPTKKDAYRRFLVWLSKYKGFKFISYCNKNTEFGHINYDLAILENELNLLGCPNYYLKNNFNMHQNESVHTMVRMAVKHKVFIPNKRDSGRSNLSQVGVYFAMFNENYNAHSAEDDVIAMVKIRNKLIELDNENQNIFKFIESYNSKPLA